jgi:LemA protein
MSLVLLILSALLLFWGLGAYNRLMRLRAAINSSWQQLEAPLQQLVGESLALAAEGGLPSEGPALEQLRETSEALQQQIRAVSPAPYQAEPVAQLAIAHALHAAALQRVLALLEHHAAEDPTERVQQVARLRTAQQQRLFGQQLFNGRVLAYNNAVAEVPTRALAGLYGFHDAKTF